MPSQKVGKIIEENGKWVFELDKMELTAADDLTFKVEGYAGVEVFEVQSETPGMFHQDDWVLNPGNGFEAQTKANAPERDNVDAYCEIMKAPNLAGDRRGAPKMRIIIRRT